ncbi:hypothetical protein LLG95_05375 [bacterium]|nr:hypothetical protein [bacterium]
MTLGAEIRAIVDRVFENKLIPGLQIAEQITLTHKSDAQYNTETGKVDTVTTEETRDAIVRPYSAREIAQSGGYLRSLDVEIRIKNEKDKCVPAFGDLIVANGRSLTVFATDEMRIDGEVVMYVCRSRG